MGHDHRGREVLTTDRDLPEADTTVPNQIVMDTTVEDQRGHHLTMISIVRDHLHQEARPHPRAARIVRSLRRTRCDFPTTIPNTDQSPQMTASLGWSHPSTTSILPKTHPFRDHSISAYQVDLLARPDPDIPTLTSLRPVLSTPTISPTTLRSPTTGRSWKRIGKRIGASSPKIQRSSRTLVIGTWDWRQVPPYGPTSRTSTCCPTEVVLPRPAKPFEGIPNRNQSNDRTNGGGDDFTTLLPS
uniref:(northern house mosquito) hypothetical protein n=1 Tax=Culex pipiens TaxID=7175 RepID=A0A8D8KZ55_CULPI